MNKTRNLVKYLAGYLLLLLFLPWSSANAAEISVYPLSRDEAFVVISGEITLDDDAKFRRLLSPFRNASVLLESPGGSAIAALEIGRFIHEKGFSTGVAPGAVCASACAIIWLGGIERYMAPTSLLGFHAAYVRNGRAVRESGAGNALIGAYLARLGLPDRAIIFVTSAPPDQLWWLTVADTSVLGIPVFVLSEDGQRLSRSGTQVESTPLRLPTGFRWIVLQSGPEIASQDLRRYSVVSEILGDGSIKVVRTQNGMSAIALGPLATQDAESAMGALKAGRWIPHDSYLSSGNGFIAELR